MNHRTHDGTEQGVFNAVTAHLFEQGQRSLSTDLGIGCAYRGAEGRSCAIGCMIPDDLYKRDFEGRSAFDPDIRKAAGIDPKDERLMNLAVELQQTHDTVRIVDISGKFSRTALTAQLQRIAESFGLTMPEIPAAPAA